MLRFLLSMVLFGISIHPAIAAPKDDHFEKFIRPLLFNQCVSCHGPEKQAADLRLDSADGLRKGAKSGPILVPGKPDQSKFVTILRNQHTTREVPKISVSKETIEAVLTWVQNGANWPVMTAPPIADELHWAFQPVRKPPIPKSANASTPIDAFIQAKLHEKGLDWSPEADRRTLIRRWSFDLLGLPPTPEQIDAYLSDTSPDADSKCVERLLASPHYGERWARHWLDISRFADTKGYVFFEEAEFPWAWTYRDYVIQAFNEDLPYDRFIREQIAADLPPINHDPRALPALGFMTIGGRFINNQHDIIDDRIDVVTRGLLGLTVTCARCHDHKFDPVPTEDYYSLYGVFANSVEPAVPPTFLPTPTTPEYQAFAAELAKREKAMTDFVQRKRDELIQRAKERVGDYLLTAHQTRDQPRTDEFMLIADGNDLNPTMLRRWQVYLESTQKRRHPAFVAWHRFGAIPEAEFAQRANAIASDLANNGNVIVAKSFAQTPPKSMNEVAKRYGELLNAIEKEGQSRFDDPAKEELRLVFQGPESPANVTVSPIGDLALLPDRPSQGELQKFRKSVEEWRAKGPGSVPRAHVLVDLTSTVEPVVFRRGNPFQRGKTVPRQFLEVLAGENRTPFTQGSGRRELAEAIASPSNPLTARVFVNRVWMWHFGRGIVATPSDFGTRSDPPSHPELLDYLASSFIESGWSLKQLHRQIVLSRTYRQQSNDRPDARAKDPENVSLWRMNRRRLDFESMRDAMLATSGRLEPTIGGPSARDILGGNANRRTLYGFLDRLNLPGLYRTFDFPHPDATSPQRDQTTVPPQALFLMNHPFARDCAAALLRRSEFTSTTEIPARLAAIYRVCYGRSISAREMQLASNYLANGGDWESMIHGLMLANEFIFID